MVQLTSDLDGYRRFWTRVFLVLGVLLALACGSVNGWLYLIWRAVRDGR